MTLALAIQTPSNLMVIKLLQLDFVFYVLIAALSLTISGLLFDQMAGLVVGSIALPTVVISLSMVLALLVGELTNEIRIKNC